MTVCNLGAAFLRFSWRPRAGPGTQRLPRGSADGTPVCVCGRYTLGFPPSVARFFSGPPLQHLPSLSEHLPVQWVCAACRLCLPEPPALTCPPDTSPSMPCSASSLPHRPVPGHACWCLQQ